MSQSDFDKEVEELELQHRKHNLQIKAYREFYKKQYMEFLRLQMLCGKGDKGLIELFNQTNELRKELENKVETDCRPWMWITLRPSNISFTQFKEVINKLMSKKWIQTYIYVYEQTGMTEEEAGKGFHFHALIYKGTKRQQQCINEISNTCKYIFDMNHPQLDRFFHIRFIPQKYLKTKLKYILGHKEYSDQNDKNIKQKVDRVFRDRYALEEYYKSDTFEIPDDIEFYNDSSAILNEDI